MKHFTTKQFVSTQRQKQNVKALNLLTNCNISQILLILHCLDLLSQHTCCDLVMKRLSVLQQSMYVVLLSLHTQYLLMLCENRLPLRDHVSKRFD